MIPANISGSYTRLLSLVTGLSLTTGQTQKINLSWPLGGWYKRIHLVFKEAMTTGGSVATPITDGELSLVSKIFLKTPKGETLFNAGARSIYYRNQFLYGTAPYRDKAADWSSGNKTFIAHVELPCWNPKNDRPYDTCLDTRRFANGSNFELELTLGTLASMFSTTTGGALAVTVDIFVETMEGNLPAAGDDRTPSLYQEVRELADLDPSAVTLLSLEQSTDLIVERLFVGTTTGASAGVPFSGVLADTVLTSLGFETDVQKIVDGILWGNLVKIGKSPFRVETLPTGLAVLDFMPGGSLAEAFQTARYSRRDLSWVFATGSTPRISVLQEAVRGVRL